MSKTRALRYINYKSKVLNQVKIKKENAQLQAMYLDWVNGKNGVGERIAEKGPSLQAGQ